MKRLVNTVALAINSFKARTENADHIADYNAAANTYDDYYSQNLGTCVSELLAKTDIKPTGQYLDLACGTGRLTLELADKLGEGGSVTAVDLSEGMLTQLSKKVDNRAQKNVEVWASDAVEFLKKSNNNVFDGIFCCWGICYFNHEDFLEQASRVLAPGGTLSIIENREDSLKELSKEYRDCLIDYPNALQKNFKINLPKSSHYLEKVIKKSRLSLIDAWDGKLTVSHASAEDVMTYLNAGGVTSGFINAIDPDIYPKLEEKLIERLNKASQSENRFGVTHRYCAAIARKEGV